MDNKESKGVNGLLRMNGVSERERERADYYATDPKVTEALLELELFDKRIWEPACGGGHIAEVLKKHGYEVYASDLYDHGYGDIGLDFLMQDERWGGDIVTNPPFSMATEFVWKALDLVPDGNKVAMFLKLTFLEGVRRRELFVEHPPKTVYVSVSRVSCWNGGVEAKNSSAVAYAWFVWEKGYKGDSRIKWFN